MIMVPSPSHEDIVQGLAFSLILVAVGTFVVAILRREMSRVCPTSEKLGECLARSLPLPIRAIGAILDSKLLLSWWNPWDVTDPDKLLRKGARQAGLPDHDFPPEIKENLKVLCRSFVKDKVEFHWVGRLNMHDTIVSGLSHYLQLQEVFKKNPSLCDVTLNHPIVIAGLPRSGTTLTHNLLCQDPNALFIPLWQHFYPVAPTFVFFDMRRVALKIQFRFWKWVANTYGLDSAHYLDPDLPDECLFSLRIGGPSLLYWNLAPVYSYVDWLLDPHGGRPLMVHSYETYRQLLQLVQWQNPGKRLVLKCPCHALNIQIVADVIPEANIVFTHRDPRTLPASSGSLINRLHASSVVRPDWWRTVSFNTQKLFQYGQNLARFAVKTRTSDRKIFHSPYSDLTTSPTDLIRRLHDHFDLPFTAVHEQGIKKYLSKNGQNSRGKHRYSANYLGLHVEEIEAGFNEYLDNFADCLPRKCELSAPSPPESPIYDIIVVGGGISGLAAAQRVLDRSNRKASVLVLEARGRVGGRLKGADTPAGSDLGGAYVGPTQDRILRLASNLGVQMHYVYNKGDVMFWNSEHSKIMRGRIDLPPLGILGLLDFNSIMVKFEDLASKIVREDPVSSFEGAKDLDCISVKEWVDQNAVSNAVKEMFPRVVDALLCKPGEEISMLFFLWYAASGDTLKRLMDTANGAQERKLVGGANLVPQRMAERLGPRVVKLSRIVETIDQTADKNLVTISCQGGKSFRARRVVMAMPPPLYKAITWKPELPLSKQNVVKNTGWGHIFKTIMYYETAWWREQNLNGQIWDTNGPVLYTMDDCKPDNSYPALMGFILGEDAKKWREFTPAERKHAIVKQYHDLFQMKEALEPVNYVELDWNSEKFTEGSAVALPLIGSFAETNKFIREPFDRIAFAGTECATVWPGYMDGAIQAGEIAADFSLESFMEPSLLVNIEEPPPIAAPSAAPGTFEKILAWLFDTLYKQQRFVTSTKQEGRLTITSVPIVLIGLLAVFLLASSIPLSQSPNPLERELIRLGQAYFSPLNYSRMPWYYDERDGDLITAQGKVALVTGGSSGIGRAVAAELCRKGIRAVVVTSRNFTRAQDTTAELIGGRICGPGQMVPMQLDLTDQDSIRSFAKRFLQEYNDLHFFVQNAGMWMPIDHGIHGEDNVTKSGHEYMYAANYLGHFLLTQLLLDVVQSSSPEARIAVVSSVAHWGAVQNLTLLLPSSEISQTSLVTKNKAYSSGRILEHYGNTKFLQVAMSLELQRRLGPHSSVTVIPLTPGFTNTKIGSSQRGDQQQQQQNSLFGISPHRGAQTTLHALFSPSLQGKRGYFLQPYWSPLHRRPHPTSSWRIGFLSHCLWWELLLQRWNWGPHLWTPHPHAYLRDFGRLLWEQSSAAVGLNGTKAGHVHSY